LMDYQKKDFFKEYKILLLISSICLVLVIIFPINIGSIILFPLSISGSEFFLFAIFFLIAIPILVIFCGYFIFFGFDYLYEDEINLIKDHPLIGLDTKGDFFSKAKKPYYMIEFTIRLFIEEFVFRHIFLGFLFYTELNQVYKTFSLDMLGDKMVWILISSLLYALSYLRKYFQQDSIKLSGFFIIIKFLIGILLSILFLYGGILLALIYSILMMFSIYKIIAKHYNLKENKEGSHVRDLSSLRKI
ncbi:MAG: CPBP family intramembrane metalloprotease, partial [Candidatus Lokiarchaeota archaeon]|nr:CPBP family intramembrane metalloprotease [Candidatus Lokiarchaeota archaeon]